MATPAESRNSGFLKLTMTEIREASEQDVVHLHKLVHELGYSISESDLTIQVHKILQAEDHYCFVAVSDQTIIGLIHAFKAVRLTSPDFMEIGSLAVNENFRGKGVGKMLVRHLESCLEPQQNLRVRCNVKREEAQKFYEKLDFSLKKIQNVYVK